MSLPTEEHISKAGPAEKERILVGLRARLDSAPADERPLIERLAQRTVVSLELDRGAARELREAEAALPPLAEVEEAMHREVARPSPPRALTTYERGRWITREGRPRPRRRTARPRGSGRPRARRGRPSCRRARRSGSRRSGSPPGDAGAGERPAEQLRQAHRTIAEYEAVTDALVELLHEAHAELRVLRGER